MINQISVFGFRNLVDQHLRLSPRLNLISGSNGQGKTNLLEAIYVVSLSRSFRTSHFRDLIRHRESQFLVSGEVSSGNAVTKLSFERGVESKRFCVNGIRRDLFEYFGYLSVVAFSAGHVELFRGDPEQRRRFIDRGLYLVQPSHLKRIAQYTRAVRQKNSLLRDSASIYNGNTADVLDVWDLQIVDLGARIIHTRHAYIERIRSKLAACDQLFGPEAIDTKYLAANEISSTASLADIQLQLSTHLKAKRQSEFRLGRCLVGPHRDEIVLTVDDQPMQRYASAGQQRSALLALCLAQMDVYFEDCGAYPVFLIDDVDSELDVFRMNELLRVLEDRTQIFVTTSKPEFVRIHNSDNARHFRISSGRIEKVVG